MCGTGDQAHVAQMGCCAAMMTSPQALQIVRRLSHVIQTDLQLLQADAACGPLPLLRHHDQPSRTSPARPAAAACVSLMTVMLMTVVQLHGPVGCEGCEGADNGQVPAAHEQHSRCQRQRWRSRQRHRAVKV